MKIKNYIIASDKKYEYYGGMLTIHYTADMSSCMLLQ